MNGNHPLVLGIDHIAFALKNVAGFTETLQNIFKMEPKLKTSEGVLFNYRSTNFLISNLEDESKADHVRELCLVVHDVSAVLENVRRIQREHSGITGAGYVLQEAQRVSLENVDPRAALLTANGELRYPFVSVAAATALASNGKANGTTSGIKLKGFRWAVVQTPVEELRLKLVELELDDEPAAPKAPAAPVTEVEVEVAEKELTLYTHVDHVTIACLPRTGHSYARWFLHVLAMHPLGLNTSTKADEKAQTDGATKVADAEELSDELTNYDVVVRAERGAMGMRMVALEALRDNAVVARLSGKLPLSPLRLVFPESFPNSEKDQVSTFIRDNKGIGVQHIALHTPDIVYTSQSMVAHGLRMVLPPMTYYTQPRVAEELERRGLDATDVQKLGILMDAEEVDRRTLDDPAGQPGWQLLQNFSKPVYPDGRQTLFIELIQRNGAAYGFGEANVSALWRAVQAEMDGAVGGRRSISS